MAQDTDWYATVNPNAAPVAMMIIDYSRSRAIFEPTGRLDVPDTVSTNRLSVVSQGPAQTLRIGCVMSGSPGDIAGVRVGDELAAVDGRSREHRFALLNPSARLVELSHETTRIRE